MYFIEKNCLFNLGGFDFKRVNANNEGIEFGIVTQLSFKDSFNSIVTTKFEIFYNRLMLESYLICDKKCIPF